MTAGGVAALGMVGLLFVPVQNSGATIVTGVVVSDESPARPLRRATVSLIAGDLRVPLSTVTDDTGRFMFAGMPAGSYGITASKPSYVGAFYGSKRPGRGPGVPVAVREGQTVAGLSLVLTRGSVITGALRLPSGQPAHNMPVTVVEVETVAGRRHLRLTGGRAATDDRGVYRVFGLPGGDYLVQAQPSGLLTGALSNANDAPQTTAAEISWAQAIARARPGDPAAPPPAAGPERGRTMNYATVYFPGTPDVSGAAIVTVGPGEERAGVDFALALVSTAKLSGVVVGADGSPSANAQISLVVMDDAMNLAGALTPRPAVRAGADGTFAVPAVPPGRYQIVARAADARSSLWALQDVTVDGRDVTNLALEMQPGMSVSGKIVFDASAIAAPTPEAFAQARVTVAPVLSGNAATDAIVGAATGVSAPVKTDGSFAVTGLAPHLYRISVALPGGAAGPWSLRSVMSGGVDVADRALEIRSRENVENVVATFTDRPTELSGALTDQADRPAPGYPIVVFSTNRNDWTAGSRRVTAARPSTDGKFRLVGLPAGSYYLSAVVGLDQRDLEDPAFLEQLVPNALTITLGEGAKVVQNLKLAGK